MSGWGKGLYYIVIPGENYVYMDYTKLYINSYEHVCTHTHTHTHTHTPGLQIHLADGACP